MLFRSGELEQLRNQAGAFHQVAGVDEQGYRREDRRLVAGAEAVVAGPLGDAENPGDLPDRVAVDVQVATQRVFEVLLHKPFADESLPLRDAEFTRGGNSLATVDERIATNDGEIVMTWWDLLPPFVLTIPPGALNRPIGVYSTFLPARGAQLAVNGKTATASVFPYDPV